MFSFKNESSGKTHNLHHRSLHPYNQIASGLLNLPHDSILWFTEHKISKLEFQSLIYDDHTKGFVRQHMNLTCQSL